MKNLTFSKCFVLWKYWFFIHFMPILWAFYMFCFLLCIFVWFFIQILMGFPLGIQCNFPLKIKWDNIWLYMMYRKYIASASIITKGEPYVLVEWSLKVFYCIHCCRSISIGVLIEPYSSMIVLFEYMCLCLRLWLQTTVVVHIYSISLCLLMSLWNNQIPMSLF